MNDEPRPAFILDDVKGAILYDVQVQTGTGASTFILKNSHDIDMQKIKGVKDNYFKKADKKNL